MTSGIVLSLVSICIFSSIVTGQATPTPTPGGDAVQTSGQTQPKRIRRKRRRAARPAEYQGAGVLQVEYSYSGSFRIKDQPTAQAVTLALNFAATDKLQLEFSNDNFTTQKDAAGPRQSGFGNTSLGFQYTLQTEKKNRPALAFAYQATLPTASEAKGLSNGRPLHALTGIVSKQFNRTDVNFNAALLLNGRQGLGSYDKGGFFALGFSRELKNGFGFQWEAFGQTLDINLPRGAYVSTTLTYQKGDRWQYDLGTNFGLTPTTARFSVSAGVTFNAFKFYKN